MADHPHSDERDREQRIRERAYHLWQADGEPHGADAEYWERARELIGMEDNPTAGLLPNPIKPGEDRPSTPPIVEEAALQENLGEFPSLFTDQGDRLQTPVPLDEQTPPEPTPPASPQRKAPPKRKPRTTKS